MLLLPSDIISARPNGDFVPVNYYTPDCHKPWVKILHVDELTAFCADWQKLPFVDLQQVCADILNEAVCGSIYLAHCADVAPGQSYRPRKADDAPGDEHNDVLLQVTSTNRSTSVPAVRQSASIVFA